MPYNWGSSAIFANDIQYNSTRRVWDVGRCDGVLGGSQQRVGCVVTLWSSLKALCTSPPGCDDHLAQNSESMGEPPTSQDHYCKLKSFGTYLVTNRLNPILRLMLDILH